MDRSDKHVVFASTLGFLFHVLLTGPVAEFGEGDVTLSVETGQQFSEGLLGVFNLDSPVMKIWLTVDEFFLWDPTVTVNLDELEVFPVLIVLTEVDE